MLILKDIVYTHPDKDVLLDHINFSIRKYDKVALVGNNGAGKSTLLKIMAGLLQPAGGLLQADTKPYYVPQHFGQFNSLNVAAALGIEDKLRALDAILNGEVTEANMATLNDDWGIEERCSEALAEWGFIRDDLFRNMDTLSGGQKTKVFLAGIKIHKPQIVLMDEPSNHLDSESREILYRYIKNTGNTLVIVSHDRALLNLVATVCELNKNGITVFGGNYDFYRAQKEIVARTLIQELKEKEKTLRKAKETEREAIERQQKLDARGRKKQEKAGLPAIVMNGLRNSAEKSTARMKDIHTEKTGNLADELRELRKELPDKDKMKIGFEDMKQHTGKILVAAKDINYGYTNRMLWKAGLSFEIRSGDRIAIGGANGAGKTTLVRIITGLSEPLAGTIRRSTFKSIYIDQDYSMINNNLTVYDQVQLFNTGELQEYEVKSRLTHFLFTQEYWHKTCAVLSGGEKMRLILCCLTLGTEAPDIIVLDEPTNNLDLQNVEILTNAIRGYKGTLIAVSHDAYFLKQVDINRWIVPA